MPDWGEKRITGQDDIFELCKAILTVSKKISTSALTPLTFVRDSHQSSSFENPSRQKTCTGIQTRSDIDVLLARMWEGALTTATGRARIPGWPGGGGMFA